MGTLLDIAIGLILIYLAISLVVTAAQEALSSLIGMRANLLRRGIANLFGAPEEADKAPSPNPGTAPSSNPAADLLKQFSDSPLIASLTRTNRQPSYIPAENFARAVIGIASQAAAAGATAQVVYSQVEGWAETNQNTRIGAGVKLLLTDAQGDLDKLQANLEAWYNSVMDRVSGAYKRWSQWIGIMIGFAVAVLLDADSISIVSTLGDQATIRTALAALGDQVGQGTLPTDGATTAGLVNQLLETGAIGWKTGEFSALFTAAGATLILPKILGCGITGFATSLGAAFWFDTLQRFVRIRAAGKHPDTGK
ncbi:hypothetical protein [Azospirillum sp. SYSU D00513]|uniref:hypothetical protein n=1 Tax=Azospirillum sp. SYSU D00513 TaxID=2812561 RepID=UPI001A96F565|nr:hypothetical protein [Azospirillum sp. SYSU D00513]